MKKTKKARKNGKKKGNELTKAGYDRISKAYEDRLYLLNYATSTRTTYLSNFRRYYEYCLVHDVKKIYDQDSVKAYLIHRVRQGAKWQTMNSIYSAMRKLFKEVLDLPWSFRKLPRPRKERQLPEIISKEDVQSLIEGCSANIKHQTILITLYATGMRVGELTRLRAEDILSDRMQIRIRRGKGAKDRYINIPPVLIDVLRTYYRATQPADHLFFGRTKDRPISLSSIRWALRESKRRMKIPKKVSPHTLRHCYATHHLESGTDLVYLQQNLGHKHLKTTARYIHLCQERYQHINHPIDKMALPLLGSRMPSEESLPTTEKPTSKATSQTNTKSN